MVEATHEHRPDTPWVRGRFDAFSLKQSILFGRMYEDTDIEASVLPAGGRVFCIASAGDNARALSKRHASVVAVDINPVQLDYAKERLGGLPARRGTAERVMAAFRRLLPLAGVSKRTLRDFLDLDDTGAQLDFWNTRLKTRRFVAGFKGLLSITGLKAFYASPFLANLPPHFGAVMLARLDRCFALHPNRTNPFARALFLGEAGPVEGPAPSSIELLCTDAAGYLEAQPRASFTGFTLSNILDGAPPAYAARLMAAVEHAAAPNAVMVLRSFADPSAEQLADNLAARDRSMIWGVVEAKTVGKRGAT